MNKLATTTLATTSLLTWFAAGRAAADPVADIGFAPSHMLFRYVESGVSTPDFQVLPDNRYNPIVLPCGVGFFGGQLDLDYSGTGPMIYSVITTTYFDDRNQPIISTGYSNRFVLPNELVWVAPMTAGSTSPIGYRLIDADDEWRDYLFQPGDLPADRVTRIHMHITAYPDNTYQGIPILDPNPANNDLDIYVRRSCSCR